MRVDKANMDLLTEFNDSIRIFRTDRLTPNGCGNKVFKLTENLRRIREQGGESVLSFGGAWSNHLHAFALACERLHMQAVAVVRGEEQPSNLLLQHAISHGLRVHYISRADYRDRDQPLFVQRLCKEFGCDASLPEGGSNTVAVQACRRIAELINESSLHAPTEIVLAVGTGATMAGIIQGAETQQSVLGVPVVRDKGIRSRISTWLEADDGAICNWGLIDAAVPARYGKVDTALLEFVIDVHRRTGVVLDPVYNGKALKGLLETGIGSDRQVVFVHTGGVGGCLGWVEQLRNCTDRGGVKRYLSDARAILVCSGDVYQSGNCEDI